MLLAVNPTMNATYFPAALLTPLGGEAPCGLNLRFTPEWRGLLEAMRQDSAYAKGEWAATEQKAADWVVVEEGATDLLVNQSKDLRLAIFLVEAVVRRAGFAAVREGFRFLGEMVSRFWTAGLHPEADGDSFEDRSDALLWLNRNLPDLLRDQPMTEASKLGTTFSFADLVDAREGKKRGNAGPFTDYQDLVSGTSRAFYENLVSALRASKAELTAFRRLCEEKFGSAEAAPGMSEEGKAIEELLDHAEAILRDKPAPKTAEAGPLADGIEATNGIQVALGSAEGSSASDWAKAEEMVRQGQVEKGLAEMIQLAQREAGGRARFFRKLLLADVAAKMSKDYLAQSILEELAEQIDTFKLVEWETTGVIGEVWTRLYRLYKRTGSEDRAQQYYQRLCRLDPWQAFACSDR